MHICAIKVFFLSVQIIKGGKAEDFVNGNGPSCNLYNSQYLLN